MHSMTMEQPLNYQLINKLDQDVINKICAGEVVHRPLNVVKELIENSLDSGATSITVTLKNAGIKQIIIQDNGCGIHKEDLKVICDRFTTSKLKNLDDFNTLTTFGFRGEALSSISIVSQVTIISKTKQSICAYKAEYVDGRLKDENSVTPIAANDGTQIIVENLFYNMPTRKAALSETQEFNSIQDLIRKYALIFSGKCGFILKKHNDNCHVVNTKVSNSLFSNIDCLLRKNISSYLVPINYKNEKLGHEINGYFSNNDLNLDKLDFILSINSRLVECHSLKKSIKELYQSFLMKGGHPFVLISIQINPKNIDVNIHPTKNEVCFLYDEEIIANIIDFMQNKLKNQPNESLSLNSCSLELSFEVKKDSKCQILDSTFQTTNNFLATNPPPLDSIKSPPLNQSKIDSFVRPSFRCEPPEEVVVDKHPIERPIPKTKTPLPPRKVVRIDSKLQRLDQYLNQPGSFKQRRSLELTSLLNLREKLLHNTDMNLLDIVAESNYVGCVDENFVLIQYQLNLFMIRTKNFNQELFYQVFLLDFGNFDYICFKHPMSIRKLLSTYWNIHHPDIDEEVRKRKIDEMILFLSSKQELLDDYFSIKINVENETIEKIPILIENHQPNYVYLPEFLSKSVSDVIWDDEEPCFESFGKVLAQFYSNPSDENINGQYESWSKLVENNIYPLYKNLLLPSARLQDDSIFLITNIDSLYKVFERC